MTMLAELIPDARSVSRMDKLRLIRELAQDLAGDEGEAIESNQDYAVWSPDGAFDVADVMLRALAADRIQP